MADKGRRQQPGFACEECRRRKARCDRVRPTCGLCLESSTVCLVLDRKPQRGPKKGRINAMRSQIATLQWQLSQQLGGYDAEDLAAVPGMSTGNGSPERDFLDPLSRVVDLGWPDWATTAGFGSELSLGALDMVVRDEDMMDTGGTTPAESAGAAAAAGMAILTDHVRADLDQVFFDRVHPVLPIVYKRGYFSWADQIHPGPARACLRSAIRTIAAAMSAPCLRFCDQLYDETRALLEGYMVGSKSEIALEYIQAWLLLAHCELLRVGEHQALLTAARAFRLVLMARLASCEAADLAGLGGDGGFSAVEERRRTFWLGFQLDRLLCSRNDYPLTIYEEMINTRLPAPEANFQGNHYTRTIFLSEAIRCSGGKPPTTLSPFAECVVLTSLHGRCAAARSRDNTHTSSPRTPTSNNSGSSGSGGTADFWTQQAGLASAIETRMQALTTSSASPARGGSGSGSDGDALLLFANMLAHGAVMKLAAAAAATSQHQQGGRPSPSSASGTWGQITTTTVDQQQHQRAAATAAAEIVRLARLMPSSACFKAHPFLPDPLASAAGYLITAGATGTGTGNNNTASGVQHLMRVLRDMQGMNSLARDHVTAFMLSTEGVTEFVRGPNNVNVSEMESTGGAHGWAVGPGGPNSGAQMQRMHC
ncbi:putative Zn(II)2Cys6 transcription factor [Chaetomium sp. MPI-SDFR-AT-0129]|nr:putative Zn(II)2Cys6 transcription factor [Chaetomium sp. MPI-SDFR-AT-0129]